MRTTEGEEDWAHHHVISVLAEQRGVDPATISPSDRLRDYADMDSLDFVELLMMIEERLNLGISDDTAAKLDTVQELIDYVRKGMKQQCR